MRFFPEQDSQIKDTVKVVQDLYNYATEKN